MWPALRAGETVALLPCRGRFVVRETDRTTNRYAARIVPEGEAVWFMMERIAQLR
jgi:hypothetical protein